MNNIFDELLGRFGHPEVSELESLKLQLAASQVENRVLKSENAELSVRIARLRRAFFKAAVLPQGSTS
jgi:hypothetical protein